jgi:hypothetical protein
MRRHEPTRFEPDNLGHTSLSEVRAVSTHYWEQVLARKAFARALGIPDPFPFDGMADLRRLIADTYVAYGLCGGQRHAMELVRDIERQAEAQVEGPARGHL